LTTNVLDNLEKIRSIDKSDMLNYCVDARVHYRKALDIAQTITADFPFPDNVIVAGMGGSAIGGDLLKDWTKNKAEVPIEVYREYSLPDYADKKTLVIIISYSGDTEEALSAFSDALKRECMIFCISSGGALLKFAQKHSVPFVQVPSGMPPRAALPYLLVPLLVLMEKTLVVLDATTELEEAIQVLGKVCTENSPVNPAIDNPSKDLALYIDNTVPIIYGFGIFRGVAQRLKCQFNENSKSPAKWEYFSEIDHNEIVGWEHPGNTIRSFTAVFLRDIDEPVEMESRIEITKQIMEQAGVVTINVTAQGISLLARMLSIVVFGDFVSVYLAVLHEVDPTPVQSINVLKATLEKNGVKEKILAELDGV
jgi:glucose/mannose-6-phosphate isomerase